MSTAQTPGPRIVRPAHRHVRVPGHRDDDAHAAAI